MTLGERFEAKCSGSRCAVCFSECGDGAIVNASRSLTYAWSEPPRSEEDVGETIRANTERVGNELIAAPARRQEAALAG